MSGNGLTKQEARERALVAWERRRTEGRGGWTEERRAKFRATMAAKYPKSDRSRALRAELMGSELVALRADVEALMQRVTEFESRPSGIRLVEWRPDHKRHADGGQPVREQRRQVGLPKRQRAVA